jgi:hypothetical protein
VVHSKSFTLPNIFLSSFTCKIRGDVNVVGEDAGEHGPVEKCGHDHAGDDRGLFAAGQAHADQTAGGDDGG